MQPTFCLSCHKQVKGFGFYCEGCCAYLCRACGIPTEEGDKWTCPNCSTELEDFTV